MKTNITIDIPAGFSKRELENIALNAIKDYVAFKSTKIAKKLGFVACDVFYEKVPANERETITRFVKWDCELLNNGLIKLTNPRETILISAMKHNKLHFLFDGEWTRASEMSVFQTIEA